MQAITHFHIRWSNLRLDWEPFISLEDADKAAKQISRRDEKYTIEQFGSECLQCERLREIARGKR